MCIRGACSPLILLLMSSLILLSACEGAGPPASNPWVEGSIAPLEPTLSLSPRVAQVGSAVAAEVRVQGAEFDLQPTVSLGDGVTLVSVQPMGTEALALQLQVDANAVLGPRTLQVQSGDQRLELPDALLIQTGAFQVSPTAGIPGQTLDVDVQFSQYVGTQGYTFLSFGEGIETVSTQFSDEGRAARVRIRIESDAPVGLRDVSVQEGNTRLLLPDGFLVDRGLIAIAFDPPNARQGEVVNFTLTGYNTSFESGATRLNLGLGVILDANDPEAFVVQSPTLITGKMTVCESAVVGDHDVEVTTEFDEGPPEVLRAARGFTVEKVPLGVERARGSFSLSVSYTMRDGQLLSSVSASATFFASTASCSTSSGGGTSCNYEQPQPDIPQFYPPLDCAPTSVTSSSPPTPTFDAGEAVYFEAEGVSIRLDRRIADDGSISYSPRQTLDLDDYLYGAVYSIRTTGGTGAQSIPAFEVKDVLYTLNSDFTLLSPDLRDTPTLDRFDSLEVIWIDEQGQPGAQTFPVAAMSSTVRTVDVETYLSRSLYYSVLTDDGYVVYPADMISLLPVGPGLFQLGAVRPGSGFIIPGSQYTSTPGSSVYYTGYFELRE